MYFIYIKILFIISFFDLNKSHLWNTNTLLFAFGPFVKKSLTSPEDNKN